MIKKSLIVIPSNKSFGSPGYHHGTGDHHLSLAKDLMDTCAQTWLQQPTNLAAEITYFNVQVRFLEKKYPLTH